MGGTGKITRLRLMIMSRAIKRGKKSDEKPRHKTTI
jgi:hypothetical protein